MNSFAPRASDVDVLFAYEEIDLFFVCKTKQRRWASGTIKQLEFDGSITSMSSHVQTGEKLQSASMGIAFLSK